MAFPNAYLETDEVADHTLRQKILALIGVLGLAYFGLTVASMHFVETGYSPISQAVSDYAVGRFGGFMAAGFFAGGGGVTALGLSMASAKSESRMVRMGGALFVLAGIALILVGVFPTDLEGSSTTFHGTMHSALSQVVFTLGPVGLLLSSYAHGWRLFIPVVTLYLVTGAYLAANLALSLGAVGLAERFFILFIFGSWTVIAYKSFRNPPT